MTDTFTALPTKNEVWGFYGTIEQARLAVPTSAIWIQASIELHETTCADADAVRAFLDSRHGRHFADDVVGFAQTQPVEQAIDSAITRWMGWLISARTERETGIPRGLPYLTGYIQHAAIEAEVI